VIGLIYNNCIYNLVKSGYRGKSNVQYVRILYILIDLLS